MKLNKDNWDVVKFGDVSVISKENCNPVADQIERFVAGEHIQTDNLQIIGWGIVGKDYAGSAFHRRFHIGQILYGSRRTYLRKVAIADFDGVCANTTYVIDAQKGKYFNYCCHLLFNLLDLPNIQLKTLKAQQTHLLIGRI